MANFDKNLFRWDKISKEQLHSTVSTFTGESLAWNLTHNNNKGNPKSLITSNNNYSLSSNLACKKPFQGSRATLNSFIFFFHVNNLSFSDIRQRMFQELRVQLIVIEKPGILSSEFSYKHNLHQVGYPLMAFNIVLRDHSTCCNSAINSHV